MPTNLVALGVGTMQAKECPLCGERMRLVEHEATSRVPGTIEVKKVTSQEWLCPECDHFEEVDLDDLG